MTKTPKNMTNKKIMSKKEPSIVRSSSAKYLTFSELEEDSVIRNFRITAKDGKNSPIFLIINHHKYEK
jgi:hypothetical protein